MLHTPGHAPDHLCFALVGQRTVFTGDHVMGWNTTVIAPPEGSMAKFLTSLEKLLSRHDKIFLPAHGGRVQTPQRVVKAYIMHRQWRDQTILSCLEDGVSTIPKIVAKIYGELDADLKAAASLSVLAHLEYLISRGAAKVEFPAAASVAAPPGLFRRLLRLTRRFCTGFLSTGAAPALGFGSDCSRLVFSPFSNVAFISSMKARMRAALVPRSCRP